MLDTLLQSLMRRYRVPELPTQDSPDAPRNPALLLAGVIESARAEMTKGNPPAPALAQRFVQALAQLIRDALRSDAAFQALVLRHQVPQVREYVSLSAHAAQDRREVRALVNTLAHPARQARTAAPDVRVLLARLHDAETQADWSLLEATAHELAQTTLAELGHDTSAGAARLQTTPALGRLQRLHALANDPEVARYLTLMHRQSPHASQRARRLNDTAQHRGAAVEAQVAHALSQLARILNQAEHDQHRYRAVTSLRVPGSLCGHTERAKTEWDAVLLRQPPDAGPHAPWDICLLIEAKASAEAATTDFPRLLRGLQLLAQAQPDAVYACATQQGKVNLWGASLASLPTAGDELCRRVLYCCQAAAETTARPLNAAARMQLLSLPASLDFAARLRAGLPVQDDDLHAAWHTLLEAPGWHAVRDQYATLRRVRELMVDVADFTDAVATLAASTDGTALSA